MATQAKTRLNVNLDPILKEETGKVLESLGLDFTTAINIYFKKVVDTHAIPFEISKKHFTPEEIFGKNWRDGLEELEDEWE